MEDTETFEVKGGGGGGHQPKKTPQTHLLRLTVQSK